MTDQPTSPPRPSTDDPADGPAAEPAAGELVLTPPPAVKAVPPADAERSLSLDPVDATRLDEMVDHFLEGLLALDVQAPAFRDKVDDVRTLGDADVRASASVSNALLDKPMAAMKQGGLSQASSVSRSLLDLRHTVEDLDPGHQGNLSGTPEVPRRHPVRRRRQGPRLLRQVPVQPGAPQRDHRVALLRPGRAPPGQRGHRRRAAAPVGDQRAGCASTCTSPSSWTGSSRRASRRSRRRTRRARTRSARTSCSRSARRSRTWRPSWPSASRATSPSTSSGATTWSWSRASTGRPPRRCRRSGRP